jgi:hypothetical protein
LGFAFGWLFAGGGTSVAPPPPQVSTMLWINDTPLHVAGVTLQRPTGWLDGVARALPESSRMPGLTGGRVDSLTTVPERDVTLSCVLLGVTLEQQREALGALFDLLTGELELRWPHAPTQVMRGIAGPPSVSPTNAEKAFVMDARRRIPLRFDVTIRCRDAAVYERQPRRIRLSTTPRAVRHGDLPVGGEIVINGPHSGALDIRLLSPSGAIIEQLALRDAPDLPVSLLTGDSLTIRLDAPNTLTKRTAAGVETSVYAWRSLALSTRWWKAPTRFTDRARDQWVQVQMSTGTGWWTYAVGNAQ